ncbi:hypothetical protein [Klebsiella pneumoniae]|uniref:Lipoprotein n=1 Tax=Klebsiella pneumoniae TaxID=573 RepID=A0A9J6S5R7_KLEPN|nr:hypothetical protein [Klebsiella pneumoniae]MRL38661.1 hypothetical protein [Klebsiella pneumoniae]HBU8514081.1 hypothetical protein [Klebsiella pneumoniae]HBU9927288.1 hypothetical protein [Klebsiella pneumoniae]HBV5097541.1 hypothetical protein [Klebsiella pneumoniae]HBX6200024.1 hypothetical protein [Klebsiella pneumoniae]
MTLYRKLMLAVVTIAAIAACSFRNSQEDQIMTPSITYLHLLRHTPFFTALNTDQLRWVIDHSREWDVKAGGTIVSNQHTAETAGYWILLDGGWSLKLDDQTFHSGHADPGKWFNQDIAPYKAELISSEQSYVMHISSKDMNDMLARGFRFDHHLDAGKSFYNKLVSIPLPDSATKPDTRLLPGE